MTQLMNFISNTTNALMALLLTTISAWLEEHWTLVKSANGTSGPWLCSYNTPAQITYLCANFPLSKIIWQGWVTTFKMPGRVISILTFPVSTSTPLGIVTRKYILQKWSSVGNTHCFPLLLNNIWLVVVAHTCGQAGKEEAGESLNNTE